MQIAMQKKYDIKERIHTILDCPHIREMCSEHDPNWSNYDNYISYMKIYSITQR